MNLSQLYYFKRLAELKHYTNTAKELFITQPTLSDAISALEEELESALFEKEGRKIELTAAGREFYGYVCLALNELDNGITQLKYRKAALGGRIEIGCIPTLLSDYLPDAVSQYRKEKNATVEINIHSGFSREVIEKVADDSYDLGFCAMAENRDGLFFVPILNQKFIAIVRKGHVLSGKGEVGIDELDSYPVISYRKDYGIGQELYELTKRYKLDVDYIYDDEITLGGMVEATDCIALVAKTPYLRLFSNIKELEIREFKDKKHPIAMVFKQKKYTAKAVEEFADYIVAGKRMLDDEKD